ncbi:hypothetical protein NC651_037568 [Populus alba x Populus x berolinensis]|nr:hypothetical protein NC651_037568 [Populus alba x Populus x berolinensis]
MNAIETSEPPSSQINNPLNNNSSTKHHPASIALIPDQKNHLRPNLPTNNHQPKTSSNSSSPLTRSSQQKLLQSHRTISHLTPKSKTQIQLYEKFGGPRFLQSKSTCHAQFLPHP